jgi:hypothetical protein
MAVKPITWIFAGVGAAVIGLMIFSTTSLGGFKVEVCKSFQGREACGTGVGNKELDAMNTATQVACAKISSGMTDSHNCQVSNPVKVTWLQRQ